ncbi:hypothetical protein JYU15_00625 [bacterium AH-315-I18]|nr:hypothetical protein [Phycisphaeraceae bacterium]MBN4060918.1 hypothetical protein [bacterium AH-315-I18]
MADLINSLEYELAQPPAKAGLRLVGEHFLAGLYDINRRKARRVLDVMVERGYLVRRHGSGTYLRKIPVVVDLPENYIAIEGSIFSQNESQNKVVRLQPVPGQQQLTLGLWSDLDCGRVMQQSLLGGIKHRVAELGHLLETHSSVHEIGMPLSSDELEVQLRDSTCDGYMIITQWADQFLEAVNRVWPNHNPPIVYIWPGSVRSLFEPMIKTDTQDAVERGVLHLIEGGFTKIGLIDTAVQLSNKKHDIGYQVTMACAGLPCFPSLRLHADYLTNPNNIDAINQWLDQNPAIEAVCVMSENLLELLAKQFQLRGKKLGHDIGVVSISNRNSKLPKGTQWSCMEFEPSVVGSMAVNSLVSTIVTAGHALHSFSHQAHWRPGQTHLRQQIITNETQSKPLAKRVIPTGALV